MFFLLILKSLMPLFLTSTSVLSLFVLFTIINEAFCEHELQLISGVAPKIVSIFLFSVSPKPQVLQLFLSSYFGILPFFSALKVMLFLFSPFPGNLHKLLSFLANPSQNHDITFLALLKC